jgi:hypothetical protein
MPKDWFVKKWKEKNKNKKTTNQEAKEYNDPFKIHTYI